MGAGDIFNDGLILLISEVFNLGIIFRHDARILRYHASMIFFPGQHQKIFYFFY